MSRTELIESIAIVVSVFALMPWAFGYRSLWYDVVLVFVLLLMGWLAVRRIGRLSDFFRGRR